MIDVNSDLRPSQQMDLASRIEWRVSDSLIGYDEACAFMEERASAIAQGQAAQCVWLLEHPALYTAGTSARAEHLLEPARFPVFSSGRGGQYTYHGPGQRVAYLMLDLRQRGQDVRAFVYDLEEWLICALWQFHIRGERRQGRVGIWVSRPERGPECEEKIAAIGIRVRRWVSFHGVSLNVEPDLEHFSGIVPCGINDSGVTSLADLGLTASMNDVDIALRQAFEPIFGPTLR